MRSCVLITGATSGIGGAIARLLSQNYDLILHGRNPDKIAKLLPSLAPGNHKVWIYDLNNAETLQHDFEDFVTENKLVINKFVHSAGMVKMTTMRAVDLQMLQESTNVNAFSAILITASLMKGRIAGKTLDSIVYISSVTGFVGTRGKALYGASKGMLSAFVKASAVEFAPKVRINAVCPAAVETEMSRELLSDPIARAAVAKRHPLGIGKPENICGMVEFLLSDKASWITGQQIFIDGGALCDLTFK
jgi:NAD(P)-dependent dehydrogenase (short-subunit alcohol dehydrogenase family)